MKYLKRFESVRFDDNIISSLKDIFKDLSDDIFDVYIEEKSFFGDKDSTLTISIYKNSSGKENAAAEDIYLYEIKDYIKRSIEYLRSEGLELITVIPYGCSKNSFIGRRAEDVENWNPDDIVMAMNIFFK